ncbi:MAG: nucleoside recognition domain-containing protein [Chthoniobacter sp.]
MLNWIWLAFLVIAVLVGGFTGKLPQMTTGAFEAASDAVMKIALPLVGVMAIWLGIMRLAERSGLVQLIARALRPLLRILFPEVPADHPAMGAMVMNMAANMLGLGNAATPLGLRAMSLLERLNPRPGTATNAMCTFLAINTASIQLVPTTAIAILAVNHAQNPTAIVLPAFLATCIAACSGVCAAKVLERLPMFRMKEEGEAVKEEATDAAPVEEVAVKMRRCRRCIRSAPLPWSHSSSASLGCSPGWCGWRPWRSWPTSRNG